jgi:hypothetical protein
MDMYWDSIEIMWSEGGSEWKQYNWVKVPGEANICMQSIITLGNYKRSLDW